MTPLWFWQEEEQAVWFGHVNIMGVWCWYAKTWPWTLKGDKEIGS